MTVFGWSASRPVKIGSERALRGPDGLAIRPPQSSRPFRGGNEGVKRVNRGEFGRTGPEPPSWQGICLLGGGEIVEGDVLVLENLRFGFGFLGRGACLRATHRQAG